MNWMLSMISSASFYVPLSIWFPFSWSYQTSSVWIFCLQIFIITQWFSFFKLTTFSLSTQNRLMKNSSRSKVQKITLLKNPPELVILPVFLCSTKKTLWSYHIPKKNNLCAVILYFIVNMNAIYLCNLPSFH